MNKMMRFFRGYRTFILGIALIIAGSKNKKEELTALGTAILIARYSHLKEKKNDTGTNN